MPRHTKPNYSRFNGKEKLVKVLRAERRRCLRIGMLHAVRLLEAEIFEIEQFMLDKSSTLR